MNTNDITVGSMVELNYSDKDQYGSLVTYSLFYICTKIESHDWLSDDIYTLYGISSMNYRTERRGLLDLWLNNGTLKVIHKVE